MKKFFAVLLAACFCISVFAENEVTGVDVTMPFSKGVNLSQWLEPFSGGNSTSTMFSKQDFIDMKSLGVEIVRIPIHFEEFSSGKPDYVIPQWLFTKIDNAIDWCTELKMYMIIDFHNDCDGNSKTKPDVEKVLLKIWPQIAERYKNSSEYVLYEVMNEPHFRSGNVSSDISKWNKIQGNVLKLIRSIDAKHTVIVGAENWNSVEALLKLPDYKDNNIIYNFHDYSPFCFSHQGASWTFMKDLTGIPFPYDKSKMPPLPKNASADLKYAYNNYENDSSEKVLVKPLDDAVAFANKRKVALMCNEYGVSMKYADVNERANWYRLKNKWMDDRNIIRISWDYKAEFGIFNSEKATVSFPDDVNKTIIEAMGYTLPANAKPAEKGWISSAKINGEYILYKNRLGNNITTGTWVENIIPGKYITFDDSTDNSDLCISIPCAKAYNYLGFQFNQLEDLSSLKDNGLCLEFEIKTTQKNFNFDIYFMNEENYSLGKNGIPWRCGYFIRGRNDLCDGKWHKVKIPLNQFSDYGAWSNKDNKWCNSENLFDWKKIDCIRIDFGEKDLTEECCFRNIVIK